MDVLVHGGAGSEPSSPTQRRHHLDAARTAGGTCAEPLSAVRSAVNELESAPCFNAGVGSGVQADGVIRTDAGLMTSRGVSGGACAMSGVEHAIDVAHAVAEETPHVLLAGDGALELAESIGIRTNCDLWTDRTRDRWAEADPPPAGTPAHREWVRSHFGGTDTVGAVATDGEDLAAATSTGGRWFALAGRVGDVPQVGAGFYANGSGAASATGHGEAIARFGLARRVVDAMESGEQPQTAAEGAIEAFAEKTGGIAGVITIDADGNRGRATNAADMQTA